MELNQALNLNQPSSNRYIYVCVYMCIYVYVYIHNPCFLVSNCTTFSPDYGSTGTQNPQLPCKVSVGQVHSLSVGCPKSGDGLAMLVLTCMNHITVIYQK